MRTLSGVNLDDSDQRSGVFKCLRMQKSVIDFYLREVVFPRGAKEFEHKLTSSGWDIAEARRNPTTGFSGTNDNRFLLPLTIQQNDLPENLETNAKVLRFLLEPMNDHYQEIQCEDKKFEALLTQTILQNETWPIRVIIDVGAQILLDNATVARRLLEASSSISWLPKAAIYFSEDDEIVVQTMDGSVEKLQYSPFAQQLGSCFVYLDEVHTRGTDLKLPAGTRAAVTLGPKLTKDKLVQGIHQSLASKSRFLCKGKILMGIP